MTPQRSSLALRAVVDSQSKATQREEWSVRHKRIAKSVFA